MRSVYGPELDENLDRGHRRKAFANIISAASKRDKTLSNFGKSLSRWLQNAATLADYEPDIFLAYLECARRHWREDHELCYAWSLHDVVEADEAEAQAAALASGAAPAPVPGTRLDGASHASEPKEFTFKVVTGLSPEALVIIDAVLERVSKERRQFVHEGHTCAIESMHGAYTVVLAPTCHAANTDG